MDSVPIIINPKIHKVLKGHSKSITALAFSHDDKIMASGSADNHLMLWDLRGAMMRYRYKGHNAEVTDVTFSPSGKSLATSSQDTTVVLWMLDDMEKKVTYVAHSQPVCSVQYTPDEKGIITASDDKLIKIWSPETHKLICRFAGHTDSVLRAIMSSDSALIASCSRDKNTRLWDSNTGQCIHTYKDLKGHGMYLAWFPGTKYICLGTSMGNLKLYDIRIHKLVQYYSIHADAVTQLAFHPTKHCLVSASKDATIKVVDLNTGALVFTLNNSLNAAVNAVTYSETGTYFAAASADKLIGIWKT